MIGFYDYTVILTYFSLLSATSGIVVALSGGGHPYYGCLFLLFCGLCDAFDGKVARTKKGRTKMEKDFGIPCTGVYIRVQTKVDWTEPSPIAATLVPKKQETREVMCEIQFGDSYGLKL